MTKVKFIKAKNKIDYQVHMLCKICNRWYHVGNLCKLEDDKYYYEDHHILLMEAPDLLKIVDKLLELERENSKH